MLNLKSKIYLVIGQGNTITMSRVFDDGSHMTEDITENQLPYTITDLNGKLSAYGPFLQKVSHKLNSTV